MSPNPLHQDELVDRACATVRQEAEGLDAARTEAALERVRERLGVAPEVTGKVLGCADLQRLLPAFLAGTLSHERELLVADHTRTCIACRRALKTLEAGEEETAPAAAAPVRGGLRQLPRWAWAAAAAVALLLGLQLLVLRQVWPGGQGGVMLRVLKGAVIGLGEGQGRAQAFGSGADAPYGQQLVTPRGQSAMVRLADGSVVEIKERSRLTVLRRRGGTVLELEGGNVIVEAAKQEEGKHLWVDTGDARVEVVGTVFAVNHGTRGSRVSVFEGEVKVAQAGRAERVLHRGDQATTSARVKRVALAEEVEWSDKREEHLALLAGMAMLQREMAALPRPEKRFDTDLLDRLPEGTVFYAALPNLSTSLDEGLRRLQARIAEDPELSAALGSGDGLATIGRLAERLAGLGGELGDELVATGWIGADRQFVGPVAIAEVGDPAGFRARLEAELATLQSEHEVEVTIVEDPSAAVSSEHGLLVWIGPDVVVIAPEGAALAGAAAALQGAPGAFRDSSFHAAVADRYQNGVDGILAVDLAGILARGPDDDDREHLGRLGLSGVRHLVVEQWVEEEKTRRHAVLSFAGARQGIASWLAAPAPMQALTFVSPEATTVMSFVVKEPALVIEDVIAALTAEERERFETDRQKFVSEHGWDPIEDLARPLGGEIVFGIDGPLAPEPSWKLVVEVYDPARLQSGIERLVADLDGVLRREGKGSLSIEDAGDDEWVITRVKETGSELAAHYRFVDGYMVATPNAALLDRALKYRSSGQSLLQSARLRNLLPPDAQVNLSALWYSDFSSLAGAAGALSGLAEGAAQQQMPPAMQRLASELGQGGPTVVFAYGEEESIRVSSSSPRSALGLADLFLLSNGGLGAMQEMGGHEPGAIDG